MENKWTPKVWYAHFEMGARKGILTEHVPKPMPESGVLIEVINADITKDLLEALEHRIRDCLACEHIARTASVYTSCDMCERHRKIIAKARGE